MKISMEDRENFAHWFLITCVSSEQDTHSNSESKFNKIVKSENYDAKSIEFSVKINGQEFSNLEDVFKRVEDHIEKQVEKRLAEEHFDSLKIDKIRDILDSRTIADLEYL
jgi:hypothetical protein